MQTYELHKYIKHYLLHYISLFYAMILKNMFIFVIASQAEELQPPGQYGVEYIKTSFVTITIYNYNLQL